MHHRLKEERIDEIYTSDRIRTIQSAEIIFGGRKIEKVESLREMDFGIFEGMTYNQIMKKYSYIYKMWLSNPYGVTIPKGESLKDFGKRISKAFNKLIALNKNKTFAVVCHGGTISVFINEILGTKNFWRYIPDSGSLSIVEYKNGKPKIRLFNNTLRLRDN